MNFALFGAAVIAVGVLAFVGTFYVAIDVRRQVDEMARLLPSEALSHALDILNDRE